MMVQDQYLDVPMNKITIRQDDFDFRMPTEEYIRIHEEFIKRDLVETAVVQLTHFGKLVNFEAKKDTIEYMNTAPNWDIQLHCWEHKSYAKVEYKEIVKELSASMYYFKKLFNKFPTVWYPPYNEISPEMAKAGKEFGMRLENGLLGIEEFVKIDKGEVPVGSVSVHFHGWAGHEMVFFDRMMNYLKKYEDR